MTIEFWPRRLLRPRAVQPAKAKRPRRRWPELPIPLGKAHQKLSQAIICGDHELASWLDGAAMRGLVTGRAELVQELRERLDEVMAP
ncbi:MAG: hypothetical protein ACUVQG_06785 [Thermogutta sp.]